LHRKRPAGLEVWRDPNQGKYKVIVSSAGRDTGNAEEELPLASHFVSIHPHAPHAPILLMLIALLMLLLTFLTLPSSPLALLMSFTKKISQNQETLTMTKLTL